MVAENPRIGTPIRFEARKDFHPLSGERGAEPDFDRADCKSESHSDKLVFYFHRNIDFYQPKHTSFGRVVLSLLGSCPSAYCIKSPPLKTFRDPQHISPISQPNTVQLDSTTQAAKPRYKLVLIFTYTSIYEQSNRGIGTSL